MHLRHRRVPAGQHRHLRRALHRRAGRLGRLAGPGETSYCFDGQVYTAASAVRWIQDLGFIRGAADLDTVAAADAEGVLCVPALAGLAAPWWRPDAKASFSGLTLSTGSGHLVLAVLQGIAAQVAELGDLVAADLGQPLTRLRVDGGLTRSRPHRHRDLGEGIRVPAGQGREADARPAA
ncbi:FGGY-family carbohydrate kinase [Streptosporangium sp. NPDC049644]|uniref:FGGY-family carbohydrate kinase n=1 Tax=Streptosporangium sp. NPDC049644 TaxID=3155507 RepID=UPI003442AAF2